MEKEEEEKEKVRIKNLIIRFRINTTRLHTANTTTIHISTTYYSQCTEMSLKQLHRRRHVRDY